MLYASAIAQTINKPAGFEDTASRYFSELSLLLSKETALWNRNLYGPILFVDPVSRKLVANRQDSAGELRKSGNVFIGQLPNNLNIANTAIDWNGTRWAMIKTPIPTEMHSRKALLTHESFHCAQLALGFTLNNPDNPQLDTKDGRVSLRLELAALKKSVNSLNEKDRIMHLSNALYFRLTRYQQFSQASVTENDLELNEGLAEFTATTIALSNIQERARFLSFGIDGFLKNPSYIRSFAYATTPSYGFLLWQKDKKWTRNVHAKSNLTQLVISGFNLKIDTAAALFTAKAKLYDGANIVAAETEREARIKTELALYRKKLVEEPHTEILLVKMNVSFNPGTLLILDDKGTIYPNMRVVDEWGILNVTSGGLMSPGWNKITLSAPTSVNDTTVKGNGWDIELKPGWRMRKAENGNYSLQQFR